MGGRPNTSRKLLPRTAHMQVFDLREQARRWCPAALRVVVKCLKSEDEKVRLAAAILFERSYGKAPLQIDATATHRFVEAPATMGQKLWLERRSQPVIEGEAAPKAVREICPDNKQTLTRDPADDDTKLNSPR
jgi:hypothetical protein